jgi:two-component system LytT family response regulator
MDDAVTATVLVADDEPIARRIIRTLLEPHPDFQVIGECRDGATAASLIRSLEPKVVFLDVQMPRLDGLGVLRVARPTPPPAVVFVTAYEQFAVRAFEAEAVDYLVKPFSDDRFHQTVDRVRRTLARQEAALLSRRLSGLLEPGPKDPSLRYRNRFLASLGRQAFSVPVEAVRWIEARGYYAKLHTGDKAHLVRHSLTALEGELDPRCFVRSHRGALVNLAFVTRIESSAGGECSLVLQDGTRLPVSGRRRRAVERCLGGNPPESRR